MGFTEGVYIDFHPNYLYVLGTVAIVGSSTALIYLWNKLSIPKYKPVRPSKCSNTAAATYCVLSGTHIKLHTINGVGILRLESPGKVNILNEDVMKEVVNALDVFENDSSIHSGVVISSKTDCFIAGADIKMLSNCKSADDAASISRSGQEVMLRIENSKKPIVAAVMGTCLGGGLEVALSCHYRIAVNDKSTFALPEVLIGVLPGACGTTRLPRLVGLPNALDIILTGRNLRADKAKEIGLVDELVNPIKSDLPESDKETLQFLEEIAILAAREIVSDKYVITRGPMTLKDEVINFGFQFKYARDYVFKQAKQKVMKETKGLYPAPLKILEVMKTGFDKGVIEGYKVEAEAFGYLATTKEAKALMSLFHGQTTCKKNRFGDPVKPIEVVGVLGADTIGPGIVELCIEKGYKTVLKDENENTLARVLKQVESNIQRSIKRKRYSQARGNNFLSNLRSSQDVGELKDSNIIIEAFGGELELMNKAVTESESVNSNSIFAATSPTVRVSSVANMSSRPEKVVGMNYFSPVEKSLLIEIIGTNKTSKDTLASAVSLGLKQGKVAIVVKDGPGFYTTRLLVTMASEVFRLVVEGIKPKKIDTLSEAYGFRSGSVTLIDEFGFDVIYKVYKSLLEDYGNRVSGLNDKIALEILSSGFLGKKSEKGFYLYSEGSKKKTENPEMNEILNRHKVSPLGSVQNEDIQLRLVSRFVNEAVMCLQEGIIDNPLEGDIGAVFGLGFPPITGGPFHFVDSFGAQNLVDKMKKYEVTYGSAFTPCDMLLNYASQKNKTFF